MLLLITGFLVMGISQTSNAQTRFDPNTMVLLSIDPVRDGYTPENALAFFEKLPERLKTAGPVSSIALAAQAPFSIQDDEDGAIQLTAEDSGKSSRVQQSVIEETVGAGYFATFNEPVLAGREFEQRNQRGQADGSKTFSLPVVLPVVPPVVLPVLLNETAERKLFGNENAIGQRVRDDKRSYEVVGVVRNLKNGMAISQSAIYLPLTQRDLRGRQPVASPSWCGRTREPMRSAAFAIRSLPSIRISHFSMFKRSATTCISPGLPRDRLSVPTAELECSAWYWPPSD
jgi:hypothetical protein